MAGKGTVQKITIEGIGSYHLVVQSCDVTCRANLISHPVESGAKVFDNKVREPRTITIRALVSAIDQETIHALYMIWMNRSFSFYKITTRAGTYENFCCEECSHKEDAEKLNSLQYTIRFREIMMASKVQRTLGVDDTSVLSVGSMGT